MLPESSLSSTSLRSPAPSLRQGLLEEKVGQALIAGATRSTIREAVDELAMHLRRQQVPVERGVAVIAHVAAQALATRPSESRNSDTSLDYLALVTTWARNRYARAD